MRSVRVVILQISVLLLPLTAFAQETEPAKANPDEEEIHAQLRTLRDDVTKAIIEGDPDGQVARVHDNVVVTWQNNQVVRTADGLKKFLGEMNSGGTRVFQGYTVPPTADELAILHGDDTAIAFGKSTPHYKYMGMEFDLDNRWTATLVKDGDQWKIAAYHVSANVMDNPVLNIAKRSVYWAVGGGLLVGLVVGGLGARLLKRSDAAGT